MSTGTATARTAPGVTVPKPSLLARALPAFSGTTGFVLKLLLLAVTNGIGLWALVALLRNESWIAALSVLAATLAIDAVYLLPIRSLIPLKFLIPGTVFLVGFQLIPIVYNASVAFSNWSTGHNLTKEEAIRTIQETSLAQPPNGAFYTMTPAREDGTLVLLLVDQATGKTFVGTEDGLTALPPADATVENGAITQAKGYDVLKGDGLAGIDQELATLVVPAGGDSFVRAEGLSTALELKPTLRYDAKADTFTNIETGVVFSDNGKGSYATPAGEEIDQGWRTNIGLANFKDVFTDPLIRDPFVSTFAWTFSYALLSVLLTFSRGALHRDRAEPRRAPLPARPAVDPDPALRDPRVPVAARLARSAERRLRRREQHPALRRALALRPVLGPRVVPARQLLARDPVHVPHLHRARSRRSPVSSPRRRASTAPRDSRCSGRSPCPCSSSPSRRS